MDAHGGPLYVGSCCFHKRDALTGKKYEKGSHINWKQVNEIQEPEREILLEETAKFANCSYEESSFWGKEVLSLTLSIVRTHIHTIHIM